DPDEGIKAKDGTARTRKQSQIEVMGLLHSIWGAAWSPQGPLARYYHITDVETPEKIERAENTLNQYHMWKKHNEDYGEIIEISSVPLDSSPYSRIRVSPSVASYIKNPVYVARRYRYKAAYLPLNAIPSKGTPQKSRLREINIMTNEIRMAFMDAVVRQCAHRLEELRGILETCIGAKKAMNVNEAFTESMWGVVKEKVRKEFELGKAFMNTDEVQEVFHRRRHLPRHYQHESLKVKREH
ncbi:hypothetical protein HDU76_011916, partial [Blyttiomyces sp. JEL0837]